MSKKKPQHNRHWFYFSLFSLAILSVILLTNAWVVDDAYITFRTVDNFVNGYGLTWNVGERVQVYTHPLWMILVSIVYFITSELFYTSIVLNFVLTMAAIWIVATMVTRLFGSWPWRPALLVLTILASKAVVDYASSGLENALSYLIIGIFLAKLLSVIDSDSRSWRDLGILLFLASLAFVNRPDTLLLYFPAVAYLIYLYRTETKSRLIGVIIVAMLPAMLWVLFSLVYYGYPFPNTAYAKVLSTGAPLSWKVQKGWDYFTNSLHWDTASWFIVGIALWLSVRSRRAEVIAPMVGVLVYVVYTVFSAASATHMSGRFFAVPFFISIVIFIYSLRNTRFAQIIAFVLLAYVIWSPVSAVKYGTSFYKPYAQDRNCIDTKYFVLQEGAALLNWESGKQLPDHDWLHYGEAFRSQPQKVHIGGALKGDAIGYFGFAAGPDKYILDRVALSCPLLSRLPAFLPPDTRMLKCGHLQRLIPQGYAESIASGRNVIVDDSLRQFYDVIRVITRGPVFNFDRFGKIWNMNLGKYDHLFQNYASRVRAMVPPSPRR